MLAVTEWATACVFEANAVTVPMKVLWSQVAYLGTLTCGPFLLYFASAFTRHHRLLKSPVALFALWSVPAVSLVLAFTNGSHGLIWSSLTFRDSTHRVLDYGHGAMWWVMAVHVYTVVAIAAALLATDAIRLRHIYRSQSIAILVSLFPPVICNAIYAVDPQFFRSGDPSPVAFALTGLILSYSFSRLQLFDLVPVARDRIVEGIQDGVVVLDARGRIVDANAAAERLIGVEALVGQEAVEIFMKLAGTLQGIDIMDSLEQPPWDGIPASGEIASGDDLTIEWRIDPLDDHIHGRAGYLVILRDVTQRHKAELAMQSINTRLEGLVGERTAEILGEKERSEAILRSVSDGVLTTDGSLDIRYVNPAFSTMTGYTSAEALGHAVADLLGDDVRCILPRAHETEVAFQGEARARRKDGRMLDLELTISLMQNVGGDAVGYVWTLHDISRSRDLDRARKGFLDNISHQLRTPLTTLKLYNHLLGKAELPERHQQSLRVMDEQVQWLEHLIQDILEMTSLDSGNAIAIWAAVNWGTIFDHLTARFGPQAERAGLTFYYSPVGPELPQIKGDQSRLIQALGEIVENAIRFAGPSGAVSLTTVTCHKDDRRWLTVSVTNTGPRIPEDESQRLFERFFRGRIAEIGQTPGTGLGLSIAQSIVNAHGGRITFESDDTNTTFSVWLPAPAQELAPPPRTPGVTEAGLIAG